MSDVMKGRAVDGRRLKAKGVRTRQVILDVLESLLQNTSIVDLRMAHVAEAAGVAMSTAYGYFESLDDALFALISQDKYAYVEPLEIIRKPWPEGTEVENARAFVQACLNMWDAHRPVLRVRNIKGDEGEPRFLNARLSHTMPILNALAEKITLSKARGRLPQGVAASAYAAVLLAAIERNGAAYQDIERHSKDDLIEAATYLLVEWLS